MPPLRVAMILPGLGRVQRGAETAFIEIARALSVDADVRVELFGSGTLGLGGLNVHQVGCIGREQFENWPKAPYLRGETHYEELSFVLSLLARRAFRPRDFDVAIGCSYPYVNWFLKSASRRGGPLNLFVTQNGEWPCRRLNSEFRAFDCDGLVCTNPEYYRSHRSNYRSALIPNGVDPGVFTPASFGEEIFQDARIPKDRPIVLMASALTPTKRVGDGVRAVAKLPNAFMFIVGDGPERQAIATLASELLPGRHLLLGSVPREKMASIYRRSNTFLHMSQDEPFGIVYLEAASSGLSVVAHDGDIPHWILGDTALFANTSDLDAVAAALRAAILPEAKWSYGQPARIRVATHWTWHQQAARYRNFIEELLQDRRGWSRSVPRPDLAASIR